MTVVDSRVRIVALLAQQRPEAVVGIRSPSGWTSRGWDPRAPYDLSLDEKKYELAKDVAAFANAAGGLLVYGFKATRRPADLIEAVVKRTPFAKRLVNTERYKAVIADLVRPSIRVEFSWYDDPGDPDLGHLVIEVPALTENACWALVTKTLNENGKLVKGGIAIPKRHGDDTQYLPPDTVYQPVNSGLRGGPVIDLGLAVEGGAAVDVTVTESVIEGLVESWSHSASTYGTTTSRRGGRAKARSTTNRNSSPTPPLWENIPHSGSRNIPTSGTLPFPHCPRSASGRHTPPQIFRTPKHATPEPAAQRTTSEAAPLDT